MAQAKNTATKTVPTKAKAPVKDQVTTEQAPVEAKAEVPAAAPIAAPAAVETKPAAKPAAVRKARHKAAVAKPAAAKKAAARKAPAKKSAAKKPVAARAAKVAAKTTKAAVKQTVAKTTKTTTEFTQEFIKMTTPEELTKGFQTAVADATAKSKEAYEKGTALVADATEFSKGNVEAIVESSKILASGMQELGRSLVADSKAEFEALTGEVKELAAVKSPTDFFQLQSALLRKYFDKSVATASKNTEAVLKLANDAAQPLSSRVSLAMEKIKAA